MPITDPIADLLTRMRNAIKAKNRVLLLPASTEKKAILQVFQDAGYIQAFQVQLLPNNTQQLKVELKYSALDQKPAIVRLGRLSKPGLRKYTQAKNIPYTLNGLGVTVISTSKGIMSDKQARRENVGGEPLCYIY